MWDVNTYESHIFPETLDWRDHTLQARLGRIIYIEGQQKWSYHQLYLYIDPRIENTIVKHNFLSEVAGWTFKLGKGYGIRWIIFNRKFVLPDFEFVENSSLDVDGVFGYDFVKEFRGFFFKAGPAGYIQPSRFCVANPLFHPINMNKVLSVYTAVRVKNSVIGVGVFFGPEAGLNMWIPQFDDLKGDNRSIWKNPELAEFYAFSDILSNVVKNSAGGKYIRIEFHTSSQRLVSLMQTGGLSRECADLIAFHFNPTMRFLDLREKFAFQANISESNCVHILPYIDKVSAKQAQRLAELGAESLPEPEDPLKDNKNFYIKFLSNRKAARVPKQTVKNTFRAILEDYLRDAKGDTGSKMSNVTICNSLSGQLDQNQNSDLGLSADNERVFPKNNNGWGKKLDTGTSPLAGIRKENVGRESNESLVSAGEVKKGSMVKAWTKEVEESNSPHPPERVGITASGSGSKNLRKNFVSTPPQVGRRGTTSIGRTQSVPDLSRVSSGYADIEGGVVGDADILTADSRREARQIVKDAELVAEGLLRDACMNARMVRELSTRDTQKSRDEAKNYMLEVMEEREKILFEAQHEAYLTTEKALKEAENISIGARAQADIHAASIIDQAMQEGKMVIDRATIEADRTVLAQVSYIKGQSDLKLMDAKSALEKAEGKKKMVEADELLMACKRKTLLDESQASSRRMAEEIRAAEIAKMEARKAIEDAHERARVMKRLDLDARERAGKMIEYAKKIKEDAQRMQKEIQEKEKEIEKIKADAKVEARRIKKDTENKAGREIAGLMKRAKADADAELRRVKEDIKLEVKRLEKARADADIELEGLKKNTELEVRYEKAKLVEEARADADAERASIKKDIEVAMKLEWRNKEDEILKSTEDRAKYEVGQMISQAKKRAGVLEKQMEALKQQTLEYCESQRRKAEELVSSQKKKENDAKNEAKRIMDQAKVNANKVIQMAWENADRVPISGDVLGSAPPITPELFFKMFLKQSDDGIPLSAKRFAKILESSKEKVTLGQLLNHNPEGGKLFLEECKRQERLVHEIELYVDKAWGGRLKYKKGGRLLQSTDF